MIFVGQSLIIGINMSRILVTGSQGLVGSAISRYVKSHPNGHEYFLLDRNHGDLTDPRHVEGIFEAFHPDYVIHTAAKVGGIGGNMAGHADYFYQNILMNTYLIHQCHLHKVKKLLAFSSVCVFPDDVVILREDVMHNGPPFSGNFAYANAKRMVDVQIRAYKSQYGYENWCSIIPGNIYGTNDLYSLTHGHVIPSLIHKLYLSTKEERAEFPVWGDGQSLREFVFADDLASILIRLIDMDKIPERLIISGFEQYSIADVVDMLVDISGFMGKVVYDPSKPNGQRNRQSDLSLLKSLFPDYKPIDLRSGLKQSYFWFTKNYPDVRF